MEASGAMPLLESNEQYVELLIARAEIGGFSTAAATQLRNSEGL
jgi:hypothetical protein